MTVPDGSAPEAAITAQNLTKRFDDETDAVKNISFTVSRGSITALLGGNGAGKTTTLSMILGILTPTSGSITVLGVDMAQNRSQALPYMNFSSPYVGLPMRLTVDENLIVYANLYGLDRVKERVAKITENLGLTKFRKQPVGKLSAGEKSRVALAKALINEPAVLLLDEPTASMDPDTADWIRNYFDSYRNETGATIFMASHNMSEVERLCDDALIMNQGEIAATGSPKDLINRYKRDTLEEVFLDIVRGEAAGQAA